MADLSVDDLERLGERARVMRSIGGASLRNISIAKPARRAVDTETAEAESLVLGALHKVGERHGVPFAHPAMIRRSRTIGNLHGKLPELMRWLRQAGVDRAGEAALLRLGLDLLYADLSARGIPADAHTLIKHLHRLPAVINKAYPDYYRAGALGWIVDPHAAERQADRPDPPIPAREPPHPALSRR